MCGIDWGFPGWADKEDALLRELNNRAFDQYMERVRAAMQEIEEAAATHRRIEAWRARHVGTDALLTSWLPTVNCSEGSVKE